MSNSVDSPTPGEVSGDHNTSVPEPAPVEQPAGPVPASALDANGDSQPELTPDEVAKVPEVNDADE